MAKKTENTSAEAVLEVKSCSYEELLAEAKAAAGVRIEEIEGAQSVTVEAKGKPVEAFLVVKE